MSSRTTSRFMSRQLLKFINRHHFMKNITEWRFVIFTDISFDFNMFSKFSERNAWNRTGKSINWREQHFKWYTFQICVHYFYKLLIIWCINITIKITKRIYTGKRFISWTIYISRKYLLQSFRKRRRHSYIVLLCCITHFRISYPIFWNCEERQYKLKTA